MDSSHEIFRDPEIETQAAQWVVRIDRGLTAAEQDKFLEWYASHPAHSAALARHRRNWQRLDRLAAWRPQHSPQPNPDLLAPPLRFSPRRAPRWWLGLAAAAAVVALGLGWQLLPRIHPQGEELAAMPTENRRLLEDGSTIKLNRGAVVTVAFSPKERRVKLSSGEAFFTVAKNPSRPFIVEVKGVDVRAVGTAFNVRLDRNDVEVLVAEGTVAVNRARKFAGPDGAPLPQTVHLALVPARHMATIDLHSDADEPRLAPVGQQQLQQALAWQQGFLTFNSRPLGEIAAELNRLNDVQLVIADENLARTNFSVTIKSDNSAGFARLLEAAFGARLEMDGDRAIIVRAHSD